MFGQPAACSGEIGKLYADLHASSRSYQQGNKSIADRMRTAETRAMHRSKEQTQRAANALYGDCKRQILEAEYKNKKGLPAVYPQEVFLRVYVWKNSTGSIAHSGHKWKPESMFSMAHSWHKWHKNGTKDAKQKQKTQNDTSKKSPNTGKN